MKHETPTRVERRPDGSTVWTFPSGHVYRVPPTPVLDRPRVRARNRVGGRVVDPDWTPPPHTDHGATDIDALTQTLTDAPTTPDHQSSEQPRAADPGPPPF
jgi:hypothetical protein